MVWQRARVLGEIAMSPVPTSAAASGTFSASASSVQNPTPHSPTQPAASNSAGVIAHVAGATGTATASSTPSPAGHTTTITFRNVHYVLPSLIETKFPDLPALIFATESINDDEREYWFQIMPIMTEDQLRKFRQILVDERTQLDALDKKYAEEMKRIEEAQKKRRSKP